MTYPSPIACDESTDLHPRYIGITSPSRSRAFHRLFRVLLPSPAVRPLKIPNWVQHLVTRTSALSKMLQSCPCLPPSLPICPRPV